MSEKEIDREIPEQFVVNLHTIYTNAVMPVVSEVEAPTAGRSEYISLTDITVPEGYEIKMTGGCEAIWEEGNYTVYSRMRNKKGEFIRQAIDSCGEVGNLRDIMETTLVKKMMFAYYLERNKNFHGLQLFWDRMKTKSSMGNLLP